MSTCESVCIGVSDYDAPEFSNESFPTARKEHRCYECQAVIPVGAKHSKVVGKWEGKLMTIRQCLPCNEIQKTFSCGDGWLYGDLWEMWRDAQGFETLTVHDPCFRKLSLESQTFLVNRWWKWKERQHK